MRILICVLLHFIVFALPSYAEQRVKGTVVSVYDADTFTVDFNIGFHLTLTETVRLMGLDTPELRTTNLKEKELGYKAKEFASGLILGKTLQMVIFEEDKYGRYLVDVILEDGSSLTKKLLEAGLAKEYWGETKAGWSDL